MLPHLRATIKEPWISLISPAVKTHSFVCVLVMLVSVILSGAVRAAALRLFCLGGKLRINNIHISASRELLPLQQFPL